MVKYKCVWIQFALISAAAGLLVYFGLDVMPFIVGWLTVLCLLIRHELKVVSEIVKNNNGVEDE